MRVAFFGTPEFAAIALEAIVAGSDTVVGVVCQPDKPAGRGQRLTPPAVKVVAETHGLPVEQPASVRTEAFLSTLRAWNPDVIVVAAYGRILPPAVLALPRFGCINIHASLLPRHRGAAPIQWAIAHGDAVTGITIMQMDEGMDTGAILLQRETPIAPDETAGSLHDRLARIGASAIREALAALADHTLTSTPQDDAAATHAPMLRKDDGRIDWTRPAVEIERRIRAFDPWPSAFTQWNGRRLRLFRARVARQDEPSAAGTIVAVGDSLRIATGAGCLECDELQLEGRKRLPAPEFVRGNAIAVGHRLG